MYFDGDSDSHSNPSLCTAVAMKSVTRPTNQEMTDLDLTNLAQHCIIPPNVPLMFSRNPL